MARRRKNGVEACPCGSGLPFARCCAPKLSGAEPAQTPEALMRSRYTAYALGRLDYVASTWAPETCPDDLTEGAQGVKWLGLRVFSSSVAPDGRTGEVEFEALGRTSNGAFRMRERSRFRRDASGRWIYVEGDLS